MPYLFHETDSGGNAREKTRTVHHREIEHVILLRCPRMDRKKLAHFLALANAAPNHPIDVTHFERGALAFSARLLLAVEEKPHAKQYIDCSACGYRHMRGIPCPSPEPARTA